MPKISSYRKSRWLKKEDVLALSAAQRQTVVERMTEEDVGDDANRPVCWFQGIDKGWAINMTGLEVLEDLAGSDDADAFAGMKVELFVDPSVKFQGKRVGGIKIRGRKADADDEEGSGTGDDLDDALAPPF